MITNILAVRGYKRGYLAKSDSAMIQPIFATANLAVRRKTLDEAGAFDINCKTGEDVDLSIRVAKTKWELFFEPKAIIRHKHRTNLSALLKQWFRYGKLHPYIFKKHTSKCIEIYYPNKNEIGWSSLQFSKILGLPVPLHILIFVTPFHIFNMLYLLIIFSIITKIYWLLMIFLVVWLFLRLYFSGNSSFRNKRNKFRIIFSILRYILNWTYVIGAFFGGLKIGVIYIEATREESP